jgi:predicted RNase H-like HicB family nuclease
MEIEMARAVFMAAFQPEDDGGFSVTFPDVPAAITQGDDFEAALLNAIDALETVLEETLERGESLPQQSNHTKLAKSITKRGAQAVAIPVSVPGHTIRVNVMLDESLLGRIDREAEARGQSRSGFLAEAAKTLLRSA